MGSYGFIWGSYWGLMGGKMCPIFLEFASGPPPPLFSITLGHKKMCPKVLVRVETPPFWKISITKLLFFFMASLTAYSV